MQLGLQLNSQHPATENLRDRLQELLEQVRLAQAVGGNSQRKGAVLAVDTGRAPALSGAATRPPALFAPSLAWVKKIRSSS